MKRNLTPVTLFVAIVLFFACQRELNDFPPTVPPVSEVPDDSVDIDPPPLPVADNKIITNVQGRILDESGKPMPGAVIRGGSSSTSSDEFGIFRLSNVLLSERFAFITAVKPGYFTGSRTFGAEANGTAFIQIRMMRKNSAGNINSSSGGEVNVTNNAAIKIPASSIVTASGEAFNGNLKVFAALMDPDAPEFDDIMPGSLKALNADSQAVALKSYGMLNVVLETENGQSLQIAPGKTAEVRIKVPASLTGNAPANIPLWHFSELDGIWREEGSADLRNGWYVGNVGHFSTWNVDVPADFVMVKLRVKGEKGTRRPYTRVRYTNEANGLYSEGFTDSAGYINTWVPKGAPLKLEVLTDCGDLLSEQNVGPYSSDADVGTISVERRQMVQVYGTVSGCDDEPVTTGYAVMRLKGLNYSSDILNGEFYFYTEKCVVETSAAEIYITDSYRAHQTPPTVVQVGSQNVNAGNFVACELSAVEMVAFSLGGDSVVVDSPSSIDYLAFIGDTATRITFHWGIYDVGYSDLTVEFYDTIVGRSTVLNPVMMLDHSDTLVAIAPMVVDVKKIEKVGKMMHLGFSGLYRNTRTSEDRPLNGEMWVKRRK